MTRHSLEPPGCGSAQPGGEAPPFSDARAKPCNGARTSAGKCCGLCSSAGGLSAIDWTWAPFDAIPTRLLYDALRLRQDIFIVEQNVPYPDIDSRDLVAKHLFAVRDGELVGYLRALPSGIFAPGYLSFGRVVVAESLRGLGLGRQLVARCMAHFDGMPNRPPIKISSQLYLKDFYASFDFHPVGEPYIEDRIPHIAMVRE